MYGMWRLGRLAGGAGSELVSALLMSHLYIWISREARAYSFYFLLAVLAIWLFTALG